MDLEVEVGRAPGVAAVAVVPDDGAGGDSAAGGVRAHVGTEVGVAVVAGQIERQTAEARVVVLHVAADRRDDRRAPRAEDVDPLVAPTTGPRIAEVVGERAWALHRADPLDARDDAARPHRARKRGV